MQKTNSAPHPTSLQKLAELFSGDQALMQQFTDTLLTSNHDELVLIQKAFAQDDLPSIQKIAHKIKGAARLIEAKALIQACEQLEQTQKLNDIEIRLQQLTEAMKDLESLLRSTAG